MPDKYELNILAGDPTPADRQEIERLIAKGFFMGRDMPKGVTWAKKQN